jgi:hypothetical protein
LILCRIGAEEPVHVAIELAVFYVGEFDLEVKIDRGTLPLQLASNGQHNWNGCLLATTREGASLLLMSSSYPPAEPAVAPTDEHERSPESLRELRAVIAESRAEFARGEGLPAEVLLDDIDRFIAGG